MTTHRSRERVRGIEFAELPKIISGKIRRVELRRREAERRKKRRAYGVFVAAAAAVCRAASSARLST